MMIMGKCHLWMTPLSNRGKGEVITIPLPPPPQPNLFPLDLTPSPLGLLGPPVLLLRVPAIAEIPHFYLKREQINQPKLLYPQIQDTAADAAPTCV